MSTRERHYSRWALPQEVHPPRFRCYQIMVPDERFYIAAFEGLLIELTYSKNWARDDAHTAAEVSRVWQEIIEANLTGPCSLIGADDVQFRQNGCVLEFSIDCVHWQTLYDPTLCIAEGASQHGPAGQLEEGECKEFTVSLDGNGQWLLPVPVQGGYTLEITEATGGWNDGSGFSGWYCPDGKTYVLGGCTGGEAHVGGDPDPIAFHGQLIAEFGSNKVPASSGTIVIPAGEPLEDLVFYMNDPSLADNTGSISFKVKVCAEPVAIWSHVFDFTIDNQGWAERSAGEGIYVAATGWKQDDTTGSNERCVIQKTVPGAVNILSVLVEYDWTFGSGNIAAAGHLIRTFLSGATQTAVQITSQGSGQSQTLSQDLSSDLIEVNLYACENFCTSGSVLITKITVTGRGTDPF